MIKKHQIGLFLNTAEKGAASPSWTRVKKSTELTISMDAETEDVDYIADESPTTELKQYKPSIEQPLKMIKGEPDFEAVWPKFYSLATGQDAKMDYLVVFIFDKVGTGEDAEYKAWSGEALVTFNELNAVDSELSFAMAFGGTVRKGTCKLAGTAPDYKPTFTEGTGTGPEQE